MKTTITIHFAVEADKEEIFVPHNSHVPVTEEINAALKTEDADKEDNPTHDKSVTWKVYKLS